MIKILIDELATLKNRLEISKNGYVNSDPQTEVIKLIKSCVTHGEYTQWQKHLKHFPAMQQVTDCPHCLAVRIEKLEKKILTHKASNEESRIKSLRDIAEIPLRFKSCEFNNYKPQNSMAETNYQTCLGYALSWKERLKSGGGLMMLGKPGTGKTHLASAILNHIVKEFKDPVLMTSVNKIIRAFRSTWGQNADFSEEDIIDRFTMPLLLVIDEIGVQYGTESEKLIFFEILNSRYENLKPTILISNETREELVKLVGERVLDRMKEGGGCELIFNWQSYRK